MSKSFKQYVNESGIVAVPVADDKYICNIFSGEKGTPIEIFNKDGDFIKVEDGLVHKLIIDIWKKSDEIDWEEYTLSFGTPDWDADDVVINMNKTKLGKIERELDKLSFD